MYLDVATVITSLATVLPVVGKTVVSWLWGGQQKASLKKTLLDAGTGKFNVIGHRLNSMIFYLLHSMKLYILQRGFKKYNIKYVCCYFMNNLISGLFQNKVKIQHLIAKSAGPFISSLNGAQRLNARDLMWLVGFVEGAAPPPREAWGPVGSFSVNKNGKYVKYEFSIEIHVNDVKLLYQIKSMLGNYGSIAVRKRTNTTSARLKISSKNDLRGIVLPIFDKYSMLTSKQYDYLYFRQCLLRNIIFFDDLPHYKRPAYTPFNNIEDILKLHYYDAWLVGFINAEGHFGTFKPDAEGHIGTSKPDASRRGRFEIGQTDGLQILESIKKRLNISSNVNKDLANCYKLATSSKRSIENIIIFLKYNPVKLKGLKRAQYLKWLHELRNNPLYYDLNIPNSY
jgi:ubiquinol-cytochrome c reductase cytochrome b subunit